MIILGLLAVSVGAGWFIGRNYMPSREPADQAEYFQVQGDQVAMILNDQLQEEKGIYREGQVYLPVEWVNDHLNRRYYWDSNEQVLVYALPEEIVYMDQESKGDQGSLLQIEDDTAYLSLELIGTYTDVKQQPYDADRIRRVFLDTEQEEAREQAQVRFGGRVRVKGGIHSPVLTRLGRGDTVTILEPMERWSKIRTGDGYIGYIENFRLGERSTAVWESDFEEPVYTHITSDEKIRLGFHQITRPEGNQTLAEYGKTAKGMNVIVPTWFNITGNDGTYTSLASREYVNRAHEMGLQVWAMVENVSTEESVKNLDTRLLMSVTGTRKKLIKNLMQEAETYGFDGFNLDFESLKAEAGPHYIQFIREMSVACRERGLVLSVDNYVPSAYTAFYDRKEQGTVADYVIIMGYDEHFAGGEAGSVASLGYVEEGIKNTLDEVPKERVINGIPFYTRVWTTKDQKTTSKAYGLTAAEKWVRETGVELEWQDDLGQYYGTFSDEGGEYQIWHEEERSLALKTDLIRSYDLAGVACWKLGFESASVWDIINRVK